MSLFSRHSYPAFSKIFFNLQPTKRYFVALFLISTLLLQLFTFAIYQQSRAGNKAMDGIVHHYQLMRTSRQAIMDAIDLTEIEQDALAHNNQTQIVRYDTKHMDLEDHLTNLEQTADLQDAGGTFALEEHIAPLEQTTDDHMDALRQGPIDAVTLKKYQTETVKALSIAREYFRNFNNNMIDTLDSGIQNTQQMRKNHLWTLIIGNLIGLVALFVVNYVMYHLLARNISDKAKLQKSEVLFARVLDGLNDGVFDYDIASGTIYYSPSYKKMMGYSEEDLGFDHEDFARYIHPDDIEQARDVIEQYVRGDRPDFYNIFRVRHKDNHWMWIMSRGIGIWEDGKLTRLIGTHTDISVQKQREEELNYFIRENERQQAELGLAIEKAESANRAKSDFLATMSHEIRTPMNAVIGLSRLMLKADLKPKEHMMVETLHANADILLSLVNDLLDISRIESRQTELESRLFAFDDLFNSIQQMFETRAADKGIQLVIHNNLHAQSYLGDTTRIQQILINLINNALKFTAQGTISVTASGERQSDRKTLARIAIADTGVGIPQEKLGLIFEKFVQADQTISRRFGGSGLGLAICKSLVEMMGGSVSVTSKPGLGSTFTIELPLENAQPAAIPAPVAEETATPAKSRGTVLLVEDYAANVMVASMMLESLGYNIDVANNGSEALEKIRASTHPYIAVLMDVQMYGMDGYETTRQLRLLEKEKGFRNLVIGATANALAGDREKCLEAGMDDYMSKPINFDLLAQKFEAIEKAA